MAIFSKGQHYKNAKYCQGVLLVCKKKRILFSNFFILIFKITLLQDIYDKKKTTQERKHGENETLHIINIYTLHNTCVYNKQ